MSPDITYYTVPPKSFPRVSGDEPADTDRLLIDGEFSPRERG